MGNYWLTTLTAIRQRDPDWRAIAAYEPPVRRFLAYRYPGLGAAERDDLVQEILLAMRERIVPRYDPTAGPFRTFLLVAIANKVRDHYRRRRTPAELDEQLPDPDAAPSISDDEAGALDLEATLVWAIRDVHDRYATGSQADLSLVYVLSGVLVDGLTNKQIAKREGLSPDQVKRKLQRLRGEILAEVFAGQLGSDSPRVTAVQHAAELARACLREPRRAQRLLDDADDARVRAAVEAFLTQLQGARDLLARAPGAEGEPDLLRGIRGIFSA